MSKKIFIAVILLALFSLPALAQEVESADDSSAGDELIIAPDAGEAIEEETEIAAEDLDVEEPGLFSWFGDIARDIQIFFTFDPIKKSELQLKKASRQLIRARETVREDPDDTKLQERLEKLDGKYQGLVERINARVENFKAENPEALELKNFLDKYTDHQLKHQEILKKLEEQVPEGILGVINDNRERHLEEFGEVMNRLQSEEELKDRLKSGLEDVEESIGQRINRMEIIEELGEAVPVVKDKINELKQESRELFQELETKRQEIREEIQERAQEEIQARIQEEAQVRAQEGIQEETQNRAEENNQAGQGR